MISYARVEVCCSASCVCAVATSESPSFMLVRNEPISQRWIPGAKPAEGSLRRQRLVSQH